MACAQDASSDFIRKHIGNYIGKESATMVDIEKIKRGLRQIDRDIDIFKNDIKRFKEKLEQQFDIEEEEIENRFLIIEEELDDLKKQKKKVERKIERELDNVE